MKRISKVVIRHMFDEDADTSFIGEYTDDYSPWAICRQKGEFLQVLEDAAWQEEYQAYLAECAKNGSDEEKPLSFDEWQEETYFEGYQLPNRGREYRFFVPYARGEKPGTELYKKYGMQDFKRMESLVRGDWYFIGIRAEAEVQTSQDGKVWQVHKISSGGLWGIESDSDKSYFEEENKNQLADLRAQLLEFGFSRHQIYRAFKKVEEAAE